MNRNRSLGVHGGQVSAGLLGNAPQVSQVFQNSFSGNNMQMMNTMNLQNQLQQQSSSLMTNLQSESMSQINQRNQAGVGLLGHMPVSSQQQPRSLLRSDVMNEALVENSMNVSGRNTQSLLRQQVGSSGGNMADLSKRLLSDMATSQPLVVSPLQTRNLSDLSQQMKQTIGALTLNNSSTMQVNSGLVQAGGLSNPDLGRNNSVSNSVFFFLEKTTTYYVFFENFILFLFVCNYSNHFQVFTKLFVEYI